MRNLKIVKVFQWEDTSHRILNQVMRIFWEKGYQGTSMDDITQALD